MRRNRRLHLPAICLVFVLALVVLGTAAASASATPAFLDVGGATHYGSAIEGLYEAGYIDGYPVAGGKLFKPDSSIWRAQFAKMICGVAGLDVTEASWSSSGPPFVDLGPDDSTSLYPHDYVAVAAENGITFGTTPSTFSPYVDITRQQLVSMVVRAGRQVLGVIGDTPNGFEGSLNSSYYSTSTHGANMLAAEWNGLLDGVFDFGPGWDPEAKATRGEAAQIMWNLLQLDTGQTPALLVSDDFSDPSSGWPVGATNQDSARYSDGRYLVNVFPARYSSWFYRGEIYDDFSAFVDGQSVSPGVGGYYGLVFRLQDNQAFYSLELDTDGYWELWKVHGADWQKLAGDFLETISRGIPDRFGVTCIGSSIEIYVNDEMVGTVDDASYASGKIGVIAGSFEQGGFSAAFDDFEVWSAPGTDPEPNLLYSDDFSSTTLPAEETAQHSLSYVSGAYQMRSKIANYAIKATYRQEFDTFTAFVDAQATNPVAGYYGLVFRAQDANNCYVFIVHPDGYCWGAKMVDGQWTLLTGRLQPAGLLAGSGLNRIGVSCEGSSITFWVNGDVAGTITDDTFSSGRLGLVVGDYATPGMAARFDDLDVWSAAPID